MSLFIQVLPNLIINIDDVVAVQKKDKLTIDIIFKQKINGRISESSYYTIDFQNSRKCSTVFNKICRILIRDEELSI